MIVGSFEYVHCSLLVDYNLHVGISISLQHDKNMKVCVQVLQGKIMHMWAWERNGHGAHPALCFSVLQPLSKGCFSVLQPLSTGRLLMEL